MVGIPFLLARMTVASLTLLAQNQQPATPPPAEEKVETVQPDPQKKALRPLTPQEEREKAIRLYDPLNRTSPIGGGDEKDPVVPENGTSKSGAASPRILPGSNNSTGVRNPMSAGPQIVDEAAAESGPQDYSGPSVLSRNYLLSSAPSPRTIKWTPILGFSSIYNTGLAPGSVPQGQTPVSQSAFGTQYSWGLSGSHLWKRDQIELGYFGSANRYYGATAYNGTNHSLNLAYGHVVTRHLTVHLSEFLSSTSQSYGLQNQAVSGTDALAVTNLPGTVSILDQGTRQSSTSLGATWQLTSRTSMTGSGGLFFVERGGVGFSGTTGQQAQGEINHRFSRKLTLGVYYAYSSYLFSKHTAVSSSNTLGGSVSYAFSRSTKVSVQLGITSIENESLVVIPLDPIIAQILGQSSGIIEDYRKSRLQNVSVAFTHDLGHRRTIQANYSRGIAPGNGLVQTSARESLGGNFSMTLFRSYHLTLGVYSDKLTSVDSAGLSYSSRNAQVGISRTLRRGLASNFSVGYQKASGLGSGGLASQIRVTTGLSWGRNDGKLW